MKDPHYFHVRCSDDLPALNSWLSHRRYTHVSVPDKAHNKYGQRLLALHNRAWREDGRVNDKRGGLIGFHSAELFEEGKRIAEVKRLPLDA